MSTASILAVLLLIPQQELPSRDLPTTYTVTGMVIDTLSEPVPSAEVVLECREGVRAKTTADAGGWFVFENTQLADGYWTARATAPGLTEGADWGRVGDGEATAAIQLYEAGTVRGRITNQAGVPVPNAHVLAIPEETRTFGLGDERSTQADSAGRFTLDRVPPGGRCRSILRRRVCPGRSRDLSPG